MFIEMKIEKLSNMIIRNRTSRIGHLSRSETTVVAGTGDAGGAGSTSVEASVVAVLSRGEAESVLLECCLAEEQVRSGVSRQAVLRITNVRVASTVTLTGVAVIGTTSSHNTQQKEKL